MLKYLVGAIAILLLALTGVGLLYRAAAVKAAESEQRFTIAAAALGRVEAQRKLDANTLAARQVTIAAQARKLAQAQEGLSQALQANPVWSDTEVPTAVQEALLRHSGGSNNAAD